MDDLLQDVPLFAGFDNSMLQDVQTVASPFSVEAGKELFRQNDPADGIYVITQGRMSVSERAPGDDIVELVEAGPGAVLGELALLDGGRRSATVRAIDTTTGLFVSRRRFEALRRDARPSSFEIIDRIRIGVARRARSVAAAIASEPVVVATALLASQSSAAPPKATVGPADSLGGHLRTLATFAEFTAPDRAALLGMGERLDAPRGTVLSGIGGNSEFLLIVLRGALRASIQRGEQLEQLSIYGPGRMAGMLSLIDGGATHDVIDAREHAIVLRIARRDFELLRRSHSELAYKLFDQVNVQLAAELRRLSRHLGRLRGIRNFNQAAAHV
jgi:CRP-like cAMP-binding protein